MWQPIETYPKGIGTSGPMVALASFIRYEMEYGELSDWHHRWYAIGCWFNGWKARSGAQFGVSPGNDWLALKDPTHWAPIPDELT